MTSSSAQTFGFADRANRLAHVGDGELAGFSIDVVAHESAARSAGGPRQHDTNEIRPEQAANAAGRKGCVREGVVVAMDEDDNFPACGLRQATMDMVLKQGDRLFMLGHDAGRAAIAGRRRDGRVGNFGKSSDFFDSVKLHVSCATA